MKKIIICLVAVLILVMMAATVVEKSRGTDFVSENIYSSWWFCLLWAVMTAVSIIYIVKQQLFRRIPLILLHGSFVVILIGALTTHLTQKAGRVHLRQAAAMNIFTLNDGRIEKLPFSMTLKSFHVEYYPGTDAPEDYVSDVTINKQKDKTTMHVSMNSIGECDGYRFCQAGYDSDGNGTILSVQYDPWGIGITYLGYLLLLVSVLWTLASKQTRMRQLYRTAVAQKTKVLLPLVLLLGLSQSATAEERTLPSNLADEFGHVCMLYNDRICPANTVATIFTTKLTGKATWKGLSANEVFTGWTFYFSYWEDVPMIRIKDSEAQRILGIGGEWASFNDFWNQYNEYKLTKPLREASEKGDHAMLKHLREADEKFNLITMFYHGELLRMYPYPVNEKDKPHSLGTTQAQRIKWFTPGDENLPRNIPEKEWFFLRKSLDYVSEAIVTGDNARAAVLIGKIRDYQHLRAPEVVPSNAAINAEIVYNSIDSMRWPVYLCLTLSLLLIILSFKKMSRKIIIADNVFVSLMLLWITVLLALRWFVGGHLPMSNGYETMQFLAWIVALLTLFMRRIYLMRVCGPLLASLCMLVAMISGASPQISQLMPVLQSPLLSVHVMIIMFSYALLAMSCIVSLAALIKMKRGIAIEQDTAFSQFLLYPAVSCLVIGIFIGAVWANVSWGNYWSWDSKETWALITFLIYAAPLHIASLPAFRKPRFYHIYNVLAFLSVLFTYFGVNYLLTGLHSYGA